MRVFVSLELPLKIRREIKKIQGLIRKKTLLTGKFTEQENLHLTLKFFGEINESKVREVKERLRGVELKSFDVYLGEVGVFSESFIRIVWVKLNGAEGLQREIDARLEGLFKKEERFMSHITIARVKRVEDKKELIEYLKSIKFEKREFRVDKFYLMKSELFSEGPVYSEIGKYNLES